MKKIIFFRLIKNLNSQPKLLKKLKVFIVLGLITFTLLGGLAIWASVSALQYLTTKSNEIDITNFSRQQIASIKSEMAEINFQPLRCWSQTQSLLAIEPWLKNTLEVNFQSMKSACFEKSATSCIQQDCQYRENFRFKTGEMI